MNNFLKKCKTGIEKKESIEITRGKIKKEGDNSNITGAIVLVIVLSIFDSQISEINIPGISGIFSLIYSCSMLYLLLIVIRYIYFKLKILSIKIKKYLTKLNYEN